MERFFEVKLVVRILYLTVLCAAMFVWVEAVKIQCLKSDECSCKTNTKPQQEISLWQIPSKKGILSPSNKWLYDFDLCHGLSKNTGVSDGGCPNSTVCQYDVKNKNMTFEIGHFGNGTFGDYNNDTKSITLTYYGIPQQGKTRSIIVVLQCKEDGHVTDADYNAVTIDLFSRKLFTTNITTKAACLRPVVVPISTSPIQTSSIPTSPIPTSSVPTSPIPTSSIPTSPIRTSSIPTSPIPNSSILNSPVPTASHRPTSSLPILPSPIFPISSSSILTSPKPTSPKPTSPSLTLLPTSPKPTLTSIPTSHSNAGSNGRLGTVYIVLVAVVGSFIVLPIVAYAAYHMMIVRRKRSRGRQLLNEEDENDEDGTDPRVQFQNALSTPVSGRL